MTFKVFRKVGATTEYEVVAHDGPRNLTPATSANGKGHVNAFTGLSIPVQPGDVVGLYPTSAATDRLHVRRRRQLHVLGHESRRRRIGAFTSAAATGST